MTTIIQRNFSAGEVSPSLYPRVDTTKYSSGLKTCRNTIVLRHGGSANRAGTEFVGEAAQAAHASRLIPFDFDDSNAYVLEIFNNQSAVGGVNGMRVIKNGSYIREANKTITGITKANPGVVTSAAHGFSNGDYVYISGVVGMTEINSRYFLVSGVTTNTFALKDLGGTNFSTSSFTTYSSGGTVARIFTLVFGLSDGSNVADIFDYTYAQSGNVITFTHTFGIQEVTRVSDTNWTYATITSFEPSIAAPGSQTVSGASGSVDVWQVTTVKAVTNEESKVQSALPSGSSTLATAAAPRTISWSAVSGAAGYNVYKFSAGVFGYIGFTTTTSFVDNGYVANTSVEPPKSAITPFSSLDYPRAIAYSQQRLFLGGSVTYPETTWASRAGVFKNFTAHRTLQDDDAIFAGIVGRKLSRVKHLVDIGHLVVFASSGEFLVSGDANGAITPTSFGVKSQSYNGIGRVAPLIINETALYIQGRGSLVRDFAFEFQVDSYRGNDLTLFSSHLVDGYSLNNDWTYQQTPNSIVWAVRSDGTLLGLTYIKDQQVFAWHRHDFENGIVESVCSIPEGTEDALYLVIKRVINGRTVRYIERMSTRQISNIVNANFTDASLKYDGRNTGSTTMTLSGGTTWDHTELLTITASSGFFTAADVGNEIQLTDAAGDLIRFTLTAYTSSTVMTGHANKTVPTGLRVAVTTWTKAVDQLGGLWHLEGQNVSIFADGYVVASPHNDSYTIQTVTNGTLTLDKPYGVILVGLPITSDIETLNIDATNSPTISDRKKQISKVSVFTEKTRGLFAGSQPPDDDSVDPLQGLYEFKIRNNEDYDSPVDLKTDTIEVVTQTQWNNNGRVFLRQVDPVPVSVLSISPSGLIPFSGGGQ